MAGEAELRCEHDPKRKPLRRVLPLERGEGPGLGCVSSDAQVF
jgi:hypothetical protein